MSKIIHVILSGGVGSRLWPLSRKSNPKQYLNLFKGGSLFAMSVDRNRTLCDDLTVVGNVDNYKLSEAVLNDKGLHFAAEPSDILLVTPSDHVIVGDEEYASAIHEGIAKAKAGYIVTFGIQATHPETGFGYIEYKEDQVLSFREKPNKETAEEFLERGNFLWNSGMFCFRADTLLTELQQYEPLVYSAAWNAWQHQKDGQLDEVLSKKIPSISIDYAVMERSKKIRVVPSSFAWSDLGSFESLYDYLKSTGHPVDEQGNMVIGTEKYSAFVGLKNTIVVDTDDALLFVQKEQSQDVKKVYNTLEKHQSKLID